jgi:hypothetical protein
LKTSRDAWNHGKYAGIAVSMPKGTISKETVKTRSYDKQFFFMGKFPELLGSTGIATNIVEHITLLKASVWCEKKTSAEAAIFLATACNHYTLSGVMFHSNPY